VISPPGTAYLVWDDNCCLDFATVTPQGIAQRETVATIDGYNSEYSAAVSVVRRWAAVYDCDFSHPGTDILRVFSSAAAGPWREFRLGDVGYSGVALGPVTDTTAVLAAATSPDIGLWMVRDGDLVDTGIRAGNGVANRPRFRPRPSGGLWLAWGTEAPYVNVAAFREGSLGVPETVTCDYLVPPEWQYSSDTPDLSRDGGEYPAVAWGASSQISGGERLCVSVPTDLGFSVADEISGAAGGMPTVARDLNGDVWVASWDYNNSANWLHTYTRATSSAPRIAGAGVRRRVEWTLSEPAPETWWAVLKSVRGGDYVPVARVRAGPSVEMSWSDAEPPAAIVSYKIRRECVDTRYVWESDAVSFPKGARPPIFLGPPTAPTGDSDTEPLTPEDRRWDHVGLSLAAAAPGPVTVRVYDLQGRLVLEQQVMAQGTDRVAIALDLGQAPQPLASGVYFARASDEAGNTSATVRVVLLK
jgi:hypothetical protein